MGSAKRNPSSFLRGFDGYRGVYHRSRIRPTRWLHRSYFFALRLVRPGLIKSSSAPDQQRTTPQEQRTAQHPGHEGVLSQKIPTPLTPWKPSSATNGRYLCHLGTPMLARDQRTPFSEWWWTV